MLVYHQQNYPTEDMNILSFRSNVATVPEDVHFFNIEEVEQHANLTSFGSEIIKTLLNIEGIERVSLATHLGRKSLLVLRSTLFSWEEICQEIESE